MEKRIYPKGTLRICLDERIEGSFSGRIYTKFREEATDFRSVGEILLRGEEIFDESGYPMAFQQRRTFETGIPDNVGRRRREPVYLSDQEMEGKRGRIKTLDIVVMTRRHSSWQGVLLKPDGGMIGAFESELDLLKMMAEFSMEEACILC